MERYAAVLCLKPRGLLPTSPRFEEFSLGETTEGDADKKLKEIIDSDPGRYVFGYVEIEKQKPTEEKSA